MNEPTAAPRAARASRSAVVIAVLALVAIGAHLALRWLGWPVEQSPVAPANVPLLIALMAGGAPLVWQLVRKVLRLEFGSDLLAGLAIVTAVLLGQYLAAVLVVLMLSGGEALEAYAVRSASSVLEALARRMPTVAHQKQDGAFRDIALEQVQVGDRLVVFPHEICPVDGTVVEGHGTMDESYLTGEPYLISKVPGAAVLSGAINGQTALSIRADRPVQDSRYAKIIRVMRDSEQRRPRLRRLGDQLGAFYTPVAVAVAVAAWLASGEALRFLAVLVVATPCPLLLAIPVAIIGAISLSARLGIVIKDPAVLEKVETCRTAIFDKTGTLTYGRPKLNRVVTAPTWDEPRVLGPVASLEQYSKHPLAQPIVAAALERGVALVDVSEASELPGQGLKGIVDGHTIHVTGRGWLLAQRTELEIELPPTTSGLECVALVDGHYAATLQFRDEPRPEGASFIRHLSPKHHLQRLLLVSGDRESEVRGLAAEVGIEHIYFNQSPEQKLQLVREETARANTIYLGDGINDAPAMTAATVGIAFGPNSEITGEAAGAVILESSLDKVDQLLHVGQRMRRIALQSAVGGMLASMVGMGLASAGLLSPVAGAILQEAIDLVAIGNALRAARPPKRLTDFSQ